MNNYEKLVVYSERTDCNDRLLDYLRYRYCRFQSNRFLIDATNNVDADAFYGIGMPVHDDEAFRILSDILGYDISGYADDDYFFYIVYNIIEYANEFDEEDMKRYNLC